MEKTIVGRWARCEALDAAKSALADAGRQLMAALKTLEEQEIVEVSRVKHDAEPNFLAGELQIKPQATGKKQPAKRTKFADYEAEIVAKHGRGIWDAMVAMVKPHEKRQVLALKKAYTDLQKAAKNQTVPAKAQAAAGTYEDLRQSLDGSHIVARVESNHV